MQPAANVSRTDMPDNEFQEKRIGKVDKKRSLPIYNIIITLSLNIYIYISHTSLPVRMVVTTLPSMT